MKNKLEQILRELTDPKMTNAAEEEVRKVQRRGPSGKFEKKQPGDEPPGSLHEGLVRTIPWFRAQLQALGEL